MRALAFAALLLVGSACGHYAPPERPGEAKKPAPASAAPGATAAADEQCEEEPAP